MRAALAVFLVAVNLAVANIPLIWTAPQAEFESQSEAASWIAAAERSDPSPGPFRVHRMSPWYPLSFARTRSPGRMGELIAWGRGTLQPMFGLPLGIEYCRTHVGAWELEDYNALFRPRLMPVPVETARKLEIPEDQPVLYFPRRSFDLWGVRYFLLPSQPDWTSRERGFSSFLDQTELIHPDPAPSAGAGSDSRDEARKAPGLAAPTQPGCFPSRWLVHYARIRPPPEDFRARDEMIGTLAFMNDPVWRDPRRNALDLRTVALVESNDRDALKGFIYPRPVGPSESVTVAAHEPQRVELSVSLDWPGLVILADTYYPGWTLTIDGKAAPIYRTNRLMRGAAVLAGRHSLVYSYEPMSFRAGGVLSAVGLLILLTSAWSSRQGRPVRHAVGSDPS